MKILRDGAQFMVVGLLQLAVDSAIYIALTRLGVAPPLANPCGRIVGAGLGFWLNGKVTFLHRTQPQLHLRFARYALLWLMLTIVSTVAMTAVAQQAGLTRSWWIKPLIEALLGAISFLLSRHWVYQR